MTTSRLGNQFVFLSEDKHCRFTVTALDPNSAKEIVWEKIMACTPDNPDLMYWVQFQNDLREKWA